VTDFLQQYNVRRPQEEVAISLQREQYNQSINPNSDKPKEFYREGAKVAKKTF
jgi:hypothetical protein